MQVSFKSFKFNEIPSLSLAHCFSLTDLIPQDFSVRVGSTFKHSGGKVYDINQIMIHPYFHPVRLYYDFAILKTLDEISYDDPNVKRIRLPKQDEAVQEGESCRVSGWGKGRDRKKLNFYDFFFHYFKNLAENGTKPEKLRAVAVKIVNQQTCSASYNTQKVKFKVTPQMLCAGWSEGVKDACSGDSVS